MIGFNDLDELSMYVLYAYTRKMFPKQDLSQVSYNSLLQKALWKYIEDFLFDEILKHNNYIEIDDLKQTEKIKVHTIKECPPVSLNRLISYYKALESSVFN